VQQLVGLHDGQLGKTAEVRLESPDALLGIHHRVVVPGRRLKFHAEAVRDHLVAGLPGVHARADAQDDAGSVGSDHVVRQVVSLGVRMRAAVALEEAERRDRLEDARPHRVVVDARRHDGDECLARCEVRHRDVVEMDGLPRILLARLDSLEHQLLVLVDGDGAIGLRDGQRGKVIGRGVGEDRGANLVHRLGHRRLHSGLVRVFSLPDGSPEVASPDEHDDRGENRTQ
jgi:hypothetical protein